MSCQCGWCTGTAKANHTLNYTQLPKITLEEIQIGVGTGVYAHVSHNARYAWVTHSDGDEQIYQIVKMHWPPTDPPNIVRGSE